MNRGQPATFGYYLIVLLCCICRSYAAVLFGCSAGFVFSTPFTHACHASHVKPHGSAARILGDHPVEKISLHPRSPFAEPILIDPRPDDPTLGLFDPSGSGSYCSLYSVVCTIVRRYHRTMVRGTNTFFFEALIPLPWTSLPDRGDILAPCFSSETVRRGTFGEVPTFLSVPFK